MNLREHVEKSIRARSLLQDGERVLMAVSGGVDSMVLLQLLHDLSASHGWKLAVAHFNHQLRGRSSDADARFVERTAKSLGLRACVGSGDVKSFAERRGLSVEMAARELRHDFFARTARRLKIGKLMLAHHADDQVELFFLRVLRGAGGEGLAGMKWQNASASDGKLQLVRPLLDIPKQELEKFACENKIAFRKDATNDSRDILRNRVRHELLPLVERHYQRGLKRTVLRLMEIIGDESAFVEATARGWLSKRKPPFVRLSAAVQRRALQIQLQRLGIEAEFDLIESLRRMSGKPVFTRQSHGVICGADGVVKIASCEEKNFSAQKRLLNLGTTGTGKVDFSGVKACWSVESVRSAKLPERAAGREFFDADKIGCHIVLRHWQPGDRFQPIGMGASVKLQDWFVNRKIPRARRRELVLATTRAGSVFWIEGERIGDRFKVTTATRRRLTWRWRRA